MCGRYDLSHIDGIAERYDIDLGEIELRANNNVRPTQLAPVITYDQKTQRNKIELMQWGLKPYWSKKLLINAQAEKAAYSKYWSPMLQAQRCLIIANAFYEWDPQTKRPVAFSVKDEPIISLGGLYDTEKDQNGQDVTKFVVMTTPPNQTVGRIHNRMAFVLDRNVEQIYLTDRDIAGFMETLGRPYTDEVMQATEVGSI